MWTTAKYTIALYCFYCCDYMFVLIASVLLSLLHLRKGMGSVSTEVYLPHEVFASIYTNYPAAFRKIFASDKEECEHFWTAVEDHPALVGHPIKDVPNWQSKTVPLSLHGDGTPIAGRGKSWSKQMTFWSMASLLVQSSTKLSQVYLYSLFDKLMLSPGDTVPPGATTAPGATVARAMKLLAWSFYYLYLGIYPTCPFESEEPNLSCALSVFCLCVMPLVSVDVAPKVVYLFLFTWQVSSWNQRVYSCREATCRGVERYTFLSHW